MNKILDKIDKPADLRNLEISQLDTLCDEIRKLIIDTVSRTGGHLAANLGVVEMTIAICKTFDPEHDKILWDVSHQAYTYKILTGRKDKFGTLRQYNGISGFCRRDESPCDAFGAGHSGTALSAALGMAAARDRKNSDEHVIAIIGDGAVGCGISLEALNNIAHTTSRLIVILNDNEMSIGSNVGSISSYLGKILANPRYNRWKKSVERVASRLKMGGFRGMYYRMEEAIKSLFLKSVIFEEFGLRYIGPIYGHDLSGLINAMTIAKDSEKPIILHITTEKGKGYSYAEKCPDKWHGTSAFDVGTGELITVSEKPGYSNVFGLALERLAEENDNIVAISAAMADGTGLSTFSRRFPDRFFDVGICEEHAAVFAAGMAAQGMIPVFAVYSTFVQRSVDYIIHDICLQNLPVIICLDRAGIVGDDGPTHHGVFDIALLRNVPNIVMMQPKDEAELSNMMSTAVNLKRPVVIRYPRGAGPGSEIPTDYIDLPLGKAEIVKEGKDIQFWALGDMMQIAREASAILAGKGIDAGIINPRFIKPLDTDLIVQHASTAKVIVTMENGIVSGGFGSAVEEALVSRKFAGKTLKFGWPDEFIPQGTTAILLQKYGLDAKTVASRISDALSKN